MRKSNTFYILSIYFWLPMCYNCGKSCAERNDISYMISDTISKINSFFKRQRWVMPLCFIISAIFTISIIVICRIKGFSGMSNTYTFNLGADIVSLAICTVLLYSIVQDKEGFSEHTRTFVLLISAAATVLFSDACCWLMQGEPNLRIWNILANLLNYISSILLIFFMFRYTVTALEIKGKFNDIATVLMNVLLIPTLISCLVNLFVPLYFSVDSAGVYRREPLFMLSQIYLAVGLNIIIICFFISKVKIKDRLVLGSFVIIPVAHQIIVRYTFGLSTEFAAMLVSIVLIFGVVVAEHEKKLLKTEKKLYESKISVMVSQIQPHFMYNALTSIAMMCTIDPQTAQEATVTFAKYLRGNMDSLKQKVPVPFTQELEHLKKYLYIEKLRFGDKLNIEYDITVDEFLIPLLSVQPLVENAVKHGVGMKKKGGTVTITTKETKDAFEVIVSDDGVGFDTSVPKKEDGRSHVGMKNTQMRIKEMCGGEVKIESTINVGTTATIRLPKEGQKNENIVSG